MLRCTVTELSKNRYQSRTRTRLSLELRRGMSYSVRRKPVVSIGDEPEHAHRAYFIGGAVSVALYGSFLIICIIRSILSFPKFKYSFENKKMVIHISLMTFGLFDLIYGISMMIEEEYVAQSDSLLLPRVVC